MPDIQPDFDAPGLSALLQIVSWVLAFGLTISLLALVAAVVTLAFKGFGHQGVQQFAAQGIMWVALAVVCLGSISGIWSFLVGFDLGL